MRRDVPRGGGLHQPQSRRELHRGGLPGSAPDAFDAPGRDARGRTVVTADDAFAGTVGGGTPEVSASAAFRCTISTGTVAVDITLSVSGQS